MLLLGLSLSVLFNLYLPKTVKAQENNTEITKITNNHNRNIILSNERHEYFLSPAMMKYQTSKNISKALDIYRDPNKKAKNVNSSNTITRLSFDDKYKWFSFDVVNRSDKQVWRINFGSSFSGRFGLFNEIKSITVTETRGRRNLVSKDGHIDIYFPLDQKSQVFIGFKASQGSVNTIPFKLVSTETSTSLSLTTYFFLFIFTGLSFFFAAIAFLKKSYGYLHFSAYYIILMLLLFLQNKFVVVGSAFVLESYTVPFMILMSAITGLLSARVFWQTDEDEDNRLSNIAAYIFSTLCLITFLMGAFISISAPLIKTLLLIGPSITIGVLIPLISIARSQQGHNEAMPFMLGWFIALFGACITILTLSGVMQPSATAINAYWYSLIPQALFFIYAIKTKLASNTIDTTMSKTVEISETDSISRLRRTKENTEQERLLKVIEQERRVMGELRKSEARRTEEMRKAKEDADVANKAKSAFLAVVTHEIRTPMTGIMGMVRLLLDSNLAKDQKEYAQTIQDSSDAMLALLNDILDFEKIEQGKMSFENISFDIHRLINGVATLMSGHAIQKNIELKTKIGDTLPKFVVGDPTRLRQILLNLTGNAVKFTDQGHVTITAELIDEEEKNGQHKIYFGVTDSGIGIPIEAQKSLFTPFAQADDSIARKFGGTGLGLAISNGLVQGMGSTININSKEDEGSTFFFTLNMTSVEEGEEDSSPKVKSTPQQTEKPIHILMVDDNEINQKVVAGFLKETEHTINFADGSKEALAILEKNQYDLILMDIELDGMNGDELTKQLRQSGNSNLKTIPIFALTGNVMPHHIEQYQEAGMNGVLSKPIDLDRLREVIADPKAQYFTKKQTSVPAVNQTNATTTENAAIKTETNSQPKSKPTFGTSEVTVKQSAPQPQKTEETLKSETLDTLKGHMADNDLQEMLDDVVLKADEIIMEMAQALMDDDMKKLSAKGHELKGMAGNFGLVEISNNAGDIESKAKTEAPEDIRPLVEAMPEMQKRAKEALDHWIKQ